MGSCLSKKSDCGSSSPVTLPEKITTDNTQLDTKKPEVKAQVKQEIFIIKHRKSHEIELCEENGIGEINKIAAETFNSGNIFKRSAINGEIRTSSCTEEELNSILIQCGRLSRTSSTDRAAPDLSGNSARKYLGSKGSFDFDNVVDDDTDRHRERRRQSQVRRRTPSREREKERRSGSRERGYDSGRRVSRSPGKRSESPIKSDFADSSTNSANSRPGKLVSVPAMDKSSDGGAQPVRRILVRRNVSPARTSENQELNCAQNQQQKLVPLSRSNSRKAEHSPYRRNPLGEIGTNIISQAPIQKPNPDNRTTELDEKKVCASKLDSWTKELQLTTKEINRSKAYECPVGFNVITSRPENLKPHRRTRSSQLSRDLDITTPETLTNPVSSSSSSYTALLLEDIHNFHQKNTIASTTPPPNFTLPPCVTKARSILEAVADLNSSTSSNFSDQKINPITEQIYKIHKNPAFVESEILSSDDLMEPSFQKYVTLASRRTIEDEDLEEQESSGSNVLVSSCWKPNSTKSSDCWTSRFSRSRVG